MYNTTPTLLNDPHTLPRIIIHLIIPIPIDFPQTPEILLLKLRR